MKPSEIRSILQNLGIELSKGMGQNFLHDSNHLDRFVELAQVAATDQVLEIGPGLGPVTSRLAKRAARVVAVEKDDQLFAWLKTQFSESTQTLELVHADALEYLDLEKDWTGWKLVSNLPYSVGTLILERMFLNPRCPKSLTVTLQHEVIQKIRARSPKLKEFGPLALKAALQYRCLETYKVPPSCFYPPPKVMSASLHLEKHSEPILPSDHFTLFEALINQGFSQRRKQILPLLQKLRPMNDLSPILKEAEIAPFARAEELELLEWIRLCRVWKSAFKKK